MCLSDEQLTAVSGSLLRKDAPLYQSKPFFVFTPENPSGGPLICLKCGTHLLSGSYLGEVLRSVSILQRPVLSNEPREHAAELEGVTTGWKFVSFRLASCRRRLRARFALLSKCERWTRDVTDTAFQRRVSAGLAAGSTRALKPEYSPLINTALTSPHIAPL